MYIAFVRIRELNSITSLRRTRDTRSTFLRKLFGMSNSIIFATMFSSSLNPTDQNRAKYGAFSVCTSPLSALQPRPDSTCLEGSRLRCNTQAARLFSFRPRSATALRCDDLSLNSSVRCSLVVRSYVGGDWSRTILPEGVSVQGPFEPALSHSPVLLCESGRRKSK